MRERADLAGAEARGGFIKIDRKAWLRFLVGLAGLALAFTAALYSTIFRDLGNAPATAILASLALLTAAIVGIFTVPYLARRVAAGRKGRHMRYNFTREGAAYMVLLAVIVVAALNTGNNMLYIIVAAMLGAILVSGIASAGMLRALELDLALPVHLFAGRETAARITLINLRPWLPALSVTVGPLATSSKPRHRWQPTVFGFPPRRPRERQWIRVKDWVWKREPAPELPAILRTEVYFPYVARNGSAVADVNLNFARRGRYQQNELGASTRFPFSFLKKTRPVNLAREALVYPPVEQTDAFFQVLPMITGEFEVFVRGRGNDLYLIREHHPEDSGRHVDWRATAKTGALKVREFTREDERKLRLVFDHASAGAVGAEAYERAIALGASLAWHFAGDETQLSLVSPGYRGNDVYGFLADLAVGERSEAASLLEELDITDDYNVIITARPRGSISTSLWACSYLLFMQEA